MFAHVGGEGGAHPRRCHGDGCFGRGKPEDMSMNSTEKRSALCMPKAIMSEISSRSGPKRSRRLCSAGF